MGIEINDVDPRVQYVPIAAQVAFTIPFEFFQDADVKIYFNDSTTPESSGYTLTGANSNGTKEVTFSTAPETNSVTKLTIERDTAVARSTNFTNSADWTPANINNEYNRLTMMIGEREGEITRSVVRPVQSAETYSLNWPDGATTSSMILTVTTSGLTLSTAASLDAVVISDSVALALGTAAAGTSTEVSRTDHVHPTTGLLLAANDLSDVADLSTAQANLEVIKEGLHTVVIAAGMMIPQTTNGCAALATSESTTNQVMTDYLAFDSDAIEYAQYWFRMPKSMNHAATITGYIEWEEAASATTHDCVWQIEMQAQGDADTIDSAWGTAVTVTDTGTSGTRRFATFTAVTPAGTPAQQDKLGVRVSRKATDGSDTLDVDAHLIEVGLLPTLNAGDDS